MNNNPPKDETPSGQGEGFQDTNKNANAAIIAPAEKISNTGEAYLIAKLALAGHLVRRGTERDFTVTRWGLSRYCPDFTALQAFALMVGVML